MAVEMCDMHTHTHTHYLCCHTPCVQSQSQIIEEKEDLSVTGVKGQQPPFTALKDTRCNYTDRHPQWTAAYSQRSRGIMKSLEKGYEASLSMNYTQTNHTPVSFEIEQKWRPLFNYVYKNNLAATPFFSAREKGSSIWLDEAWRERHSVKLASW